MSCAPTKSSARSSARQVALVGVLSALLNGAKFALSALPGIEIVSLLLLVYTVVLGWRRALAAALVFTTIEIAFYGIHTWVVMYYLLWPLLVFSVAAVKALLRAGGVQGTAVRARVLTLGSYALLLGVYAVVFGFLCAVVEACFYAANSGFFAYLYAYWLAGLPFDGVHALSNAALTLALFLPLTRVFAHLSRQLRLLRE